MKIKDNPTKHDFDTLINKYHQANFLQSWEWGEANAHQNKIIRRILTKDDEIVGGFLAIIKDAKRGRYMEIPGGPLINWNDSKVIKNTISEIKSIAKNNKCVFIRLRPQLPDDKIGAKIMDSIGAKKAPMHLHAEHTNILTINQDEEALLANMRRQTRYEIRRVNKRNIKIEKTPISIEVVDIFHSMQSDTAKRQGFIPPDKAFLTQIAKAFKDSGYFYIAKKDNKILNMALFLEKGNEIDYLEAASDIESRKEPGAYGLIWQVILDNINQNKHLNLWGIAYSDNPNHRYAGVTTFKRGFGGEDVTYIPAHDIILNRFKYLKNWLVETARRKKRGL